MRNKWFIAGVLAALVAFMVGIWLGNYGDPPQPLGCRVWFDSEGGAHVNVDRQPECNQAMLRWARGMVERNEP